MSATWEIRQGDCIERMRELPECSIDAIVTDPPYGIGFMGKAWDGEAIRQAVKRDSPGDHTKSRGRSASMHAGEYDLSLSSNQRYQEWCEGWAREAYRVLKPGGHLLASGGTRTYHRLAAGIEDAGFEIRDSLIWLYGSGFPKSLDVSKAIDKAAGAEPIVVGPHATNACPGGEWCKCDTDGRSFSPTKHPAATVPATSDAERWQGWGTALKPAHEPIVVARKPFDGTVATNVLEHGTGAINIDGCRVGDRKRVPASPSNTDSDLVYGSYGTGEGRLGSGFDADVGRWPPNAMLSHSEECVCVGERVVRGDGHFPAERGASGYGSGVPDSNGGGLHGQTDLEEQHLDYEVIDDWRCAPGCPIAALDKQSGELTSGANPTRRGSDKFRDVYGDFVGQAEVEPARGAERGGASRFFYCAKASRAERNAGLGGFAKRPLRWSSGEQSPGTIQSDGTDRSAQNFHPTVKPIDLMCWLVRLVTPGGGAILDPFLGSGTTGCAAVLEGFDFIGIERDTEYVAVAEARISWWAEHPEGGLALRDRLDAESARAERVEQGQGELFA